MEQRQNIQLGRKLADHRRSLEGYVSNSNIFTSALIKLIISLLAAVSLIKIRLVSRLHWGRGNYYKNLTHFIMIGVTLVFLLLNISTRISSVTNENQDSLLSNQIISGTYDLLQQGSNINSVLIQDSELGLKIFNHTVSEGQTLEDIANIYNVTPQTIKEANFKNYSALFLGDQVQAGWQLKIPELNGFIHEVKAGETIDNIIDRYIAAGNTEANRFNIVEFNGLSEPIILDEGQSLFIPDGNRRIIGDGEFKPDLESLKGAFIDPLFHPGCSGYSYSRGFTWYHNGVDLAKWDGCIIVSVADGIIEYAGWASQGQGYMVRINHGGGIKTEYFHGNGVFYVSSGQVVEQGDPILYMGTTGNSTGTHLHFILWKDRIAINPAPYVPYNKPVWANY